MSRLLRDPLVIFLLIGGGIFLLNSFLAPETDGEATDPNRIEITNDILAVLEDEWSARWNRPPTDQEFKGLVDAYVKEEILFREALKLGLDQSDSIIRRRLTQKMEFLTSDIADLEEVSDETLKAYYKKHADRYRREAEFGFRHLFFSTVERADAAADATKLAAQLNAGTITFEQAVESSDRTLLAPEFSITAVSIIGRQFGESFAAGLHEAKPNSDWFGPIPSGYGLHVVKVTERLPVTLPELDEIRDKVLADYRYDKREELNTNMLNSLLEQYDVVIGERAEETKSTDES